MTAVTSTKETIKDVVIRFAGDSGDGMQLTGTQLTNTSAAHGNDLATFPDYPAEIRAPAGTLAGVSGFQLHFSSLDIYTPGDAPGVLVAMNPAALVRNIKDLKPGGMVIVNTDKFTDRDLEKAECETNPLENGSLDGFQVIPVQLSTRTKESVEGMGLNTKQADRCKNFFALGITYWLFNRDMTLTRQWIDSKFKDPFREANHKALQAGYNYADTMELFASSYEVPPAPLEAGTYRNITGTEALALGFVAAAKLSGKPLFLGAYPITPASDTLHALARYKDFGVTTFQAEDEIAAIAASIGAAYAGSLAVTATSGPGIALKGEAMGLAAMTELPMVIIDVQRGGPSTGLPTKTEQSDLMQVMYGRSGEAPLPILAARTPADCFDTALTAMRIATKYMIPVVVLTDGYLANGAEPWRLPDLDALEPMNVAFANDPAGFAPYQRNPDTLARPWAVPGTPGLEHRIGGLEKDDGTGNVSYDPENHEKMSKLRAEHVERVQQDIPDVVPHGDAKGVVMLSWGGTFGAVRAAVDKARAQGTTVGHIHVRWLNPFPRNLEATLRQYDRVVIPELNMGQLVRLIRDRYLIDAVSHTKIQGQPFKVSELLARIQSEAAQ